MDRGRLSKQLARYADTTGKAVRALAEEPSPDGVAAQRERLMERLRSYGGQLCGAESPHFFSIFVSGPDGGGEALSDGRMTTLRPRSSRLL